MRQGNDVSIKTVYVQCMGFADDVVELIDCHPLSDGQFTNGKNKLGLQ